MNKPAGNTRDDLVRNFSQASAPPNDFAGAAEGGAGAFSTFPVTEIGDTMQHPPFPDASTEYRPPASHLPPVVTQRESLERNCSSGQTPWTAETLAEETMLAGTLAATRATTPTAPRLMPQQRDAIDPEGSTVEDAFRRLAMRGGAR